MRDANESRQRQIDAQCKCDSFKMNYGHLRKTLDQLQLEGICVPDPPQEALDAMGSEDVIQGYLDRIAELEKENSSLKDLKAISEDFMQRAATGQATAETTMHLKRTSYMQMPELEEVDQALVKEQMAAAEEEAYR